MSQSHGIKGGTSDEGFKALQEQTFRRRNELPLGFLHFKMFYMHKNRYNTLKEREKSQHAS